MSIAPFEPAELKIVDRQENAIVCVFRSAEGGEFPMKFQRSQAADFAAQLEKEVAADKSSSHGSYTPEDLRFELNDFAAPSNHRRYLPEQVLFELNGVRITPHIARFG